MTLTKKELNHERKMLKKRIAFLEGKLEEADMMVKGEVLDFKDCVKYDEWYNDTFFHTNLAIKKILKTVPERNGIGNFRKMICSFAYMTTKVRYGSWEYDISSTEGLMRSFFYFLRELIAYQMENDTYRCEKIRDNVLSLVDGLRDLMYKKGYGKFGRVERDEYKRRKEAFYRLFQVDVGIADVLDAIDFKKLKMNKDLFLVDRDGDGWVLKSNEMEIEVKGLTPMDLQDKLQDWKKDLYLCYQDREPEEDLLEEDEVAKWHRQKRWFDHFFPGETERLANQ